ncbi:MAG: ribbon-helix-helix protein, CopG family [Verrucomicrobia bacterium]|nr:ribbon-helix-helix protein, CopG family [Verrucomicrobiota bacterium]
MIRTRIQLPDDLYAEAKQLCEEREMSISELARAAGSST